MAGAQLQLPVIDISSPDHANSAKLIRLACLEHGFFYVTNHGVEDETLQRVFRESKKFFSMPLADKMKLEVNEHYRGFTTMYSETLDTSSKIKGDTKESFYIGQMEGSNPELCVNQWPLEGNSRKLAVLESNNGIILQTSLRCGQKGSLIDCAGFKP